MESCETHRYLGNYFYKEGIIPKAAEQYKLVSRFLYFHFKNKNNDLHNYYFSFIILGFSVLRILFSIHTHRSRNIR